MNREILFRGKPIYEETIIGKDFYFGDLCHYANGEVTIRQPETGSEMVVVPESVGQFTGITDRNGINIFEGDILPGGYKVEYLNGGFFGVRHKIDKYVHSLKKCSQLRDFIVIGNNYDNPTLLNS